MSATFAPDRTRSLAPSQDPSAQHLDDAAASVVLTTGHNWTPATLTVAAGGTLAKLSYRGRTLEVPTAPRGRIRNYSRKSRSRFLQKLASVNQRQLQCGQHSFLTLTYPRIFCYDADRWKKDLQAFCRAVERRWGRFPIIWRLEPQQRGAPHFHLLLLACPHIPKGWVARTWNRIAGRGDLDHLKYGTRIERLRSWRGVLSYASKYVAKADDVASWPPGFFPGRLWGVRNADLIPIDLVNVELPVGPADRVRRVLRKLLGARGRNWEFRGRYQGCWLFANADTQGKLLAIALE